MADDVQLFKQFHERFHSGKRRPIAANLLTEAESVIGLLFPDSYRKFALECGPAYCPSLPSLTQFLAPKQAITETRRWKLDLPKYAIFASDVSGNWYLFRDLPSAEPRLDDAPVWMFDLENGEAVPEAPSFVEWIASFLEQPDAPQ